MPRQLTSLSLTILLIFGLVLTVPAQTRDSGRLPVKRVVLYKNGVGYFEHSAHVQGTQELNIDFTTAQLNDVLKSLTVVDLGEGHISSVRYNSIAPLGERLKGLRLPFGEDVGRDDFLTAMRGARVDVRSGTTSAAGKLLSVEKVKHQNAKGEDTETTEFAIVTDAGEMRSYVLSPTVSVRLADHELTSEVGRYLDLVSSSRAPDLRQMTITATGTGERNIFVSYISEVPIWKSTYRIILPDEATAKSKTGPLLQGWAIVDNTIGEDWKDVHLSLVAGAPQSFVQNISQPFYARRPEIPLPESVQLTPQSHEATVEAEAEEASPMRINAGIAGGVPGGIASGSGGGVGSGSGGVIGGTMGASVAAPRVANGRQFDRLAQFAKLQKPPAVKFAETQAEGKSIGDFFEYDLKQNITIGQNQSALVPIVQSHVEAEKVTLWNAETVPLLALWIKNTSGQILDSGSFNIIEGNTFAGEGVLEVLHPDERRLLSYAGDSAIHVKTLSESRPSPYTRARIFKGNMLLIREERKMTKYALHNADSKPRTVIVEHPSQEGAGWKLSDSTPKPEETTASFQRFRVNVDAGKTSELAVEEFHSLDTTIELSSLDSNWVQFLVEQNRLTPAMRKVFDEVLAQKNKVSELDSQIKQHNEEITKITADQTRLRENMKALKGSAEEKTLLQRYLHELDTQEDRLDVLRKGIEDVQARHNQAQADLDQLIESIDLDEHF
jgi:hypothetical protein